MAYPLDAGKNFKVEYFEKPSDYSMMSMEVYTEYYGIGYIVSGDRQISTPERTFFTHKGYISPMSMNVYHRSTSISNEPYARYGIRFTPAMAKRIISHLGKDRFDDIMAISSYRLEPSAQDKALAIFKKMLKEYENYDRHSELLLQGFLEELFIFIIRECKISESADIRINIKDELILDILSYIDKNHAKNPTVRELSLIAGLSESHFMKRFRQSTGSTYKTYLNLYKVHIAQSLLINTDMPLNRISEELGFCNSNYFSCTFKKYMNISPLNYRKLHKEDIS